MVINKVNFLNIQFIFQMTLIENFPTNIFDCSGNMDDSNSIHRYNSSASSQPSQQNSAPSCITASESSQDSQTTSTSNYVTASASSKLSQTTSMPSCAVTNMTLHHSQETSTSGYLTEIEPSQPFKVISRSSYVTALGAYNENQECCAENNFLTVKIMVREIKSALDQSKVITRKMKK